MKKCPRCGLEIAGLSSTALCPACLLLEGLKTQATGNSSLVATNSESADNDTFGPYRILESIGEGGMGSVYLAEQTHPIQRFVALKVVKLGMDTQRVLSRFESERQVLALMDHPHIAHVYDAGTSAKGRPYFAMEYVDGLPVTQYCDHHQLNTRERLELFGSVCQALQHAHQKGVIHRDIKPSNVLVTEKDGKPFPKVIDFGIARATDQRTIEHTVLTELGQFVGTPEYMSPEQADLTSQDVDTRTDVYSLGVLLYELLVGALPFDGKWLRAAGLAELLRIIREEQAPTPSNRLTGLGDTITEIARNRRTDPATLHREVKGDLNWIVMKALDKDRRLRYASVSELAADIRRHLQYEPVSAGPPTISYRARKFVRRHRTAVIAASLIVATMLAGMIGTAWQARVARRERAEAISQRERAEAQKGTAEQQRALAEDRLEDLRSLASSLLFEIHDEIKDLSGATKARELLLSKAREYLEKLRAQGQDNPRLQQPLAAAYIKVGQISRLMVDNKSADSYAERALELTDRLTTLDARKPAPWCLRSEALLLLVPPGSAETSARTVQRRQAIAAAERCVALSGSSTASRRQLADALLSTGTSTLMSHYEEASADIKRALRLREELVNGPDAEESDRDAWAKALSQAGFLHAGKDEPEKERAGAALEELVRSNPDNATFRFDLANFLLRANVSQNDDVRSAGRRGIQILEQLSKADPANRLYRFRIAQNYTYIANTFSNSGNKADALAAFKRSTDVWEELLREEPRNPEYLRSAAWSFSIAGQMMSGMVGDPDGSLRKAVDRALVLYQRLFALEGRTEIDNHYADVIEHAAEQLSNDGETLGALRLYRRVIAECDRPEVRKDPDAARACGSLLRFATDPTAAEGDNLTALSYYQRAQLIQEQLGASPNRDDGDEYREAQLGFESVQLLWTLDRYPAAIQQLQNAATVFRRLEPTILNSDLKRSGLFGAYELIEVLQELAVRLATLNREGEARKTVEEAVYYAKRAAGRSPQVGTNVSQIDALAVQAMYAEMAKLCFDAGDRACGVQMLEQSVQTRDSWPDRGGLPPANEFEVLGEVALTALRYGEVALFEDYYGQSDGVFDQALHDGPDRYFMNVRANQNLDASKMFLKAGDAKKAAFYQRRAIEIRRAMPSQSAADGANPDPEYQFAQVLELEGDPDTKAQYAKAAQVLEAALTRSAKRIGQLPNESEPLIRRAELLVELARSLMKLDRFDEALARAQDAETLEPRMMSLSPRNTSAWQRRADTRRALGEILAAKGDNAGALAQFGRWLEVGREIYRLVGTVDSNGLFLNSVQDGAVDIARAGGIEMVRRAMREAEEKTRQGLKLQPRGSGLMIRMAELPYEWARAEEAAGHSDEAKALYARCAVSIQTLGQRMTLPFMVVYELDQSQKKTAAGL